MGTNGPLLRDTGIASSCAMSRLLTPYSTSSLYNDRSKCVCDSTNARGVNEVQMPTDPAEHCSPFWLCVKPRDSLRVRAELGLFLDGPLSHFPGSWSRARTSLRWLCAVPMLLQTGLSRIPGTSLRGRQQRLSFHLPNRLKKKQLPLCILL